MLLYPFFEFVHDLSPPVPIPPPSRTSFSLGTRHGAQTISPYHVRSHTSSSRFYCHGDGEPVGPGENASPPCLVPKGRHVFSHTRSPRLDTLVHVPCPPWWAPEYRLLARYFAVFPRRALRRPGVQTQGRQSSPSILFPKP